ncbi:hypothetical protein PMI30_00342, partial [Pseudomonas sp. GM50]
MNLLWRGSLLPLGCEATLMHYARPLRVPVYGCYAA